MKYDIIAFYIGRKIYYNYFETKSNKVVKKYERGGSLYIC